MKKQLLKKFLYLTAIIAIMSCSKEEDNPTDKESQETVLSLVSSNALPGDAVQITSNNAIPLGEIEVLLNNKAIKAYAIDNHNYVFILPVVTSGDYTLKVPVNEKSQNLNLKVENYVPIENPEAVIDAYIVNRDKCFDKMINSSSSSPTSVETLELIDQIKQEWNLQYSQATAKDKELLAYLLQSQPVDPEWFDSLTDRGVHGKKSAVTSDVGDKLVAIAKVYVTAQTVCVASIPFTLGTGYAFYHAPNFITAGLFLASFSTFVISREVAIKNAERVGRLEGVAGAILDFVTQKSAAEELTNNIEKSINMTVSFRNLNSSDNNIQADIRNAFDGEALLELKDGLLKEMYNKATKKMTKLTGLYPSYVPAIGKKAATNINLSVLGKDIIIKGSSNPLINISSSLEGDVRKIKATSTSTADVNFNLVIAYKGLNDEELTKQIPFIFKAAPSPLEGTWILESWNGVTVGQEGLYYGNTNCPSIATERRLVKSEKFVFDKQIFSHDMVGDITYFEKEIDSNCNVTKDNWDTTGSFGGYSGFYQLNGDVLSLGNNFSCQVKFISETKIQLNRGENLIEVYNKE